MRRLSHNQKDGRGVVCGQWGIDVASDKTRSGVVGLPLSVRLLKKAEDGSV